MKSLQQVINTYHGRGFKTTQPCRQATQMYQETNVNSRH